METQNLIFLKEHANNCVSAVVFCKQFLVFTVHIDRFAFLCYP